MKILLLMTWIAFSTSQAVEPTPQVGSEPAASRSKVPRTVPTNALCRNPDNAGKYHIGCGVTAPIILYQGEPEYPEEARVRRMTTSGVVISLTVDTDGKPVDAHVKTSRVDVVAKADRSIQQLLEDKMMEAVRLYKFKPATFQGKSVPVDINIVINIDPF